MNNDLISISEAKKLGATCLARRNENGQLEAIISLDNAPTVDFVSPTISPTINVNIPEETKQKLIEELQKTHKLVLPESDEYPFYQEAYQTGYEEGRKDFERPKGKWIYKEFDVESGISRSYWCSNCGEPKSQWCDDFCQRCGADMRKGEEGEQKAEEE